MTAEPNTAADRGQQRVAAWRPSKRLVVGPPPPLNPSRYAALENNGWPYFSYRNGPVID
jgi:hypothetical protein